jgi:hypothetical protein
VVFLDKDPIWGAELWVNNKVLQQINTTIWNGLHCTAQYESDNSMLQKYPKCLQLD